MGEDRFRCREARGAVGVDAVERARRGEALQLPAIEQPRIDPRREILEAGEGSALLAFLDQGFHRLLANALERAQGITDGTILNSEISMAGVYVWRQALDAATAHVLDKDAE